MRNSLALLAFAAAAVSQAVVIDDFSSGPHSGSLVSGWTEAYQAGSMLGGSRLIRYDVLTDSDAYGGGVGGPAVSVDLGDGRAIVSSGALAQASFSLQYGYVPEGDGYAVGDMVTDLSGDSAFRLSFLANDLPMEVRVYASDTGWMSAMALVVVPGGQTSPFTVEIPYADFNNTIDWTNIRDLDFGFELSRSGDFAITKLETVPEPASIAALALGGAAFISRRRRNR